MATHECITCPFITMVKDEYGREYELCMFSQGDYFLNETFCDESCELEGFAEEMYQKYGGEE